MREADAPRDWIDFLDPKFKGKLALTYPNEDDSVLYQFDRIIAKRRLGLGRSTGDAGRAVGARSTETTISSSAANRAAWLNTSGPLVPAANATTRFLLPRTDSFLSSARPTAIFAKARQPEAAKLYMRRPCPPNARAAAQPLMVRRNMPHPRGYGPLSQYNTSPVAFRDALRDRVRLEKLRDRFAQTIGPALEPNPTKVTGIFPEGS